VTRRDKFKELARLEVFIGRLDNEIETAVHRGGFRQVQKVERRRDDAEAQHSALWAELHPPRIGHPCDPPANDGALLCPYCQTYRFRDRRDRFQRGVCPRCLGEPLGPDDPNLTQADIDNDDRR
jgi:hypothetical protein